MADRRRRPEEVRSPWDDDLDMAIARRLDLVYAADEQEVEAEIVGADDEQLFISSQHKRADNRVTGQYDESLPRLLLTTVDWQSEFDLMPKREIIRRVAEMVQGAQTTGMSSEGVHVSLSAGRPWRDEGGMSDDVEQIVLVELGETAHFGTAQYVHSTNAVYVLDEVARRRIYVLPDDIYKCTPQNAASAIRSAWPKVTLTRYVGVDVYEFPNVGGQSDTRPDIVSTKQAGQMAAAVEAPFGDLVRLEHDGGLSEQDAEFVRITIQQVRLWSMRDEASPQIFELFLRDLIKVLLRPMTDPGPMRQQLIILGAEPDEADYIANGIVEQIERMTELGGDDAHQDAQIIKAISDAGDKISTAIDGIELVVPEAGKESLRRKAAGAVVTGAAGAAGKEFATIGMAHLRPLIDEYWPRVQIGVVMALRHIRDVLFK